MAQYATFLEDVIQQETPSIKEKKFDFITPRIDNNDDVRLLLAEYFNDPYMKILKKDNGVHIYGCKITSLILNGHRYIFVAVTEEEVNKRGLGELVKMGKLPFFSLQTRSIPESYDLPKHTYSARTYEKFLIPIKYKDETQTCTNYKSTSNPPFTVTLLHQKKGSSPYGYSGNLSSALETYKTIITLDI